MDAEARYARQLELVDALRAEWDRLGQPVTTQGGATGKATVVHPLVVEIQAAEMKANTLMKVTLDARKKGRPSGAGSAPDRAARLRAVS